MVAKTLEEQYNEMVKKEKEGDLIILNTAFFSKEDYMSSEEFHESINNFITESRSEETTAVVLSGCEHLADEYIVIVCPKAKVKTYTN